MRYNRGMTQSLFVRRMEDNMLQSNGKDKIEYVALYCRVATAGQFSDEAVKVQEDELLHWLKASEINTKVVRVFADKGNPAQDALTEMMQEMKRYGGKTHAAAVSADRFSRTIWKLDHLIQLADAQDTTLYAIREDAMLNDEAQMTLCVALLKGGAAR